MMGSGSAASRFGHDENLHRFAEVDGAFDGALGRGQDFWAVVPGRFGDGKFAAVGQ